ncbi:MAG TPA: beta-ketoacyl-ACP synthase II [Planctomycetota bacterium]|nr:beta-ketoacyl-ACP synthase II [Planctomycetota bacterium]HJM39353.1 beta-ketoacyl-ACP synthase II [Planctomycetota bacterium]|tara:strand:- start:6066 stop:7328 length:1263 start_codon:yes stop_codon:yes gene_type:complete
MSADSSRVVITGVGAVTPLALGAEATFKGLLAGESGVRPIVSFDPELQQTKIAAEVFGTVFDPNDHFDTKAQKRLDHFSQLGIVAGREAWLDAGIKEGDVDPLRGGTILGSGIGGIHTCLDGHDLVYESGPRRVSPFYVPNLMPNALPGNVAIEFGLEGACFLTASACASSGHAIGLALREIRSGRADLVVTGGAEAALTPATLAGFSRLRALSTRNDEPLLASRPFDRDRDGFVLGDGAAILVLESLEHAKARGARIYCELAGFGQSDDAGHITAPDATGERPARAISFAMEDAGMTPEDVDYINAHGTSTQLNDQMETVAIKTALGEENAKRVAISSTKSMVGHLLGAASAVEALVCAKTLHEGVAHGTANLENPDRENGCDLDYIPEATRQQEFRGALSNSFGFGGHNVSLAFRRMD